MKHHRSIQYCKAAILLLTIFLTFTLASCVRNDKVIFSEIPTSSTPTATNPPRATTTPTTTATQIPTATLTLPPTPGSFNNPLVIGDSVHIQPVPQEFLDKGINKMVEMECTVLEVIRGEKAFSLAKEKRVHLYTDPLLEDQEYVAILINLLQTYTDDPGNPTSLYSNWNVTLRNEQSGNDIWSYDPIYPKTEGYLPLELKDWVIFRVRIGSKPLLYFQPFLMIYERVGIRETGAYFKLFE